MPDTGPARLQEPSNNTHDAPGRTRELDVDTAALLAAREIEDLFVQAHVGGVAQRRAKIQCVVIRAMRQCASQR